MCVAMELGCVCGGDDEASMERLRADMRCLEAWLSFQLMANAQLRGGGEAQGKQEAHKLAHKFS